MRGAGCAAWFAATLCCSPASGRDLDVRLSTSAWSGDRRLDDGTGVSYSQVQAKLTHKLSSVVGVVVDGYAGYEQDFSAEPSRGRSALKEGYLSVKEDHLLATVGWQIISWGRADVVNPTDNVSAYDYTLLVPTDAEQKLGVPSLSLTYRLDAVSVQTIWQPAFRSSQIPLPEVSGVHYQDHEPTGLKNAGGLRVDVTGEKLAWSVSFFHGPSKQPNLALSGARMTEGVADTNHPYATTYGLDFEYLVGRWVIRGEAAYNDFVGSGRDLLASRESFALGVLGVERNFGNTSVFFQTTYRRVFDFVDPYSAPPQLLDLALANAVVNNEVRSSLFGLGAGFSYNTRDLLWHASGNLAYFPATHDFALRPRMKYQLTDVVSLWAGMDWFTGPVVGQFGRLHQNSAVFVGVTMSVL